MCNAMQSNSACNDDDDDDDDDDDVKLASCLKLLICIVLRQNMTRLLDNLLST